MVLKNSQAVKIKNGKNKVIKVIGKKYLNASNIEVPGDVSSSAFFTTLTLLNKTHLLKLRM